MFKSQSQVPVCNSARQIFQPHARGRVGALGNVLLRIKESRHNKQTSKLYDYCLLLVLFKIKSIRSAAVKSGSKEFYATFDSMLEVGLVKHLTLFNYRRYLECHVAGLT
jgi:hypothetical protein